MNDRFNIRYFNKNTKRFEYLKIGAVNFNLFTDWTVYEQGQFCTGLKDKNGKLIYEGDIIKIGNGSVNGFVIETTREVKWTINTWNIPVWVVDKPNFSHYVEVIGNIYENKELLESEG